MKLKLLRWMKDLCWRFVIMYTCALGATLTGNFIMWLFFPERLASGSPDWWIVVIAMSIAAGPYIYWHKRWGIKL